MSIDEIKNQQNNGLAQPTTDLIENLAKAKDKKKSKKSKGIFEVSTEAIAKKIPKKTFETELEQRFLSRSYDPARRWKLSPMDLESRNRWVEFSKAKDTMFTYTNIPEAPWFTIEADDKRRARLNCIHHLLSKVPYEDMTPPPLELPSRPLGDNYVRAPRNEQFFVPQVY